MSDQSPKTAKSKKPLIYAGVALVLVLLVFVGAETMRQMTISSSAKEVEAVFKESRDYFGTEGDLPSVIAKRQPGKSGAKEWREFSSRTLPKLTEHGQYTPWLRALIEKTGTAPTAAQAQAAIAQTDELPALIRPMLQFDHLDGVFEFRDDGEINYDLDGMHIIRALQLRVMLRATDQRAAALDDLELLLELARRMQTPFGLVELLTMTVNENFTHRIIGRLLEGGPLSPRSHTLIADLDKTAVPLLGAAEGELANMAWLYEKVGADAFALTTGNPGMGSGWFGWIGGEGGYLGAAEFNREFAQTQRSYLDLCLHLRDGKPLNLQDSMVAGIVKSLFQSEAEIRLGRAHVAFAVRVRSAADPAALVSEADKAGMRLEKNGAGNWQIALKGDAGQQTEAGYEGNLEEFRRKFPLIEFRP